MDDALDASFTDYEADYETLPVQDRDEVAEIEKLSRAETQRVGTWRLIVTALLFAAGLIVSLTTYKLLVAEQDVNFENAVRPYNIIHVDRQWL